VDVTGWVATYKLSRSLANLIRVGIGFDYKLQYGNSTPVGERREGAGHEAGPDGVGVGRGAEGRRDRGGAAGVARGGVSLNVSENLASLLAVGTDTEHKLSIYPYHT
jgi:hypothetical protein